METARELFSPPAENTRDTTAWEIVDEDDDVEPSRVVVITQNKVSHCHSILMLVVLQCFRFDKVVIRNKSVNSRPLSPALGCKKSVNTPHFNTTFSTELEMRHCYHNYSSRVSMS